MKATCPTTFGDSCAADRCTRVRCKACSSDPPPYSSSPIDRDGKMENQTLGKMCQSRGKNGIGQNSIVRWKCVKLQSSVEKISDSKKRSRLETDLTNRVLILTGSERGLVSGKEKGNQMPIVLIDGRTNVQGDYAEKPNSRERLRFPRQIGLPFSECENIPGWKAFESFTCKEGTLKGVCYRITVIRQLFRYAQGQGQVPSFALLFEKSLIEQFIDRVINDEYSKAKTKINKLWALRFALGWVDIYAGLGETEVTGSGDVGVVRYLSVLISSKVSQLHQQAKVDSGLGIEKEVMDARHLYLTKDEFKSLAVALVNELFSVERKMIQPSHDMPGLVAQFRRCLFTAFFVVIPVQRLRVIFDLRWKDVSLFAIGEGGSIQIGVEKTSFAKLGRGETIGRAVFIPEILARFIRSWRIITIYDSNEDYLFNTNGRYMVSSEASALVIATTRKLIGRNISAQTLKN